jgi:hypothetical protein
MRFNSAIIGAANGWGKPKKFAGRRADYAKIADENVMHGQNPKIMLPIRPVPYGSGNY